MQELRCNSTMAMDGTVLSINKESSSSSIGTASGEVAKAKSKGTSEFHLSGGTGPVRLDWVPHIPKIVYNLVSVAGV